MTDELKHTAEVVQSIIDKLDELFPPIEVTGEIIRDAKTFYELALLALRRRGCVGPPFGVRWESLTDSARTVWIEAMADWGVYPDTPEPTQGPL